MTVEEAQREVRAVFLGGLGGQFVSGALWLLSAALGTWASPRLGILALVVGGMFIFPITQLLLGATGRRASLSPGNPMNQLAMQVAFTIPLCLPLIGAATLHRLNWFYPAFMIVVGAHYLPFTFLYGMKLYAVLCAVLVGGGVVIGLYMNDVFSLGGWFTGAVLLLFDFIAPSVARRKDARSSTA
jgi:hypothetical protein